MVYDDSEIQNSIKSNPAIIELGQHAKLKGAVQDALSPLHVLVGTVLKKLFFPPAAPPSNWSTGYIKELHVHVESIWQVYHSLYSLSSVGLPLVSFQIQTSGHLVTLFQGNKPVAEGHIIWPHPRSITVVDDEEGNLRKINITSTRSLIELTAIFIPGYIHHLHSQCIQWIFNHGRQAVVTTSTLRTRNAIPPIPSLPASHAFPDPALLPSHSPSTAGNSSFNLSIPADGEIWNNNVNDDGDHEMNDDVFGDEVMHTLN